MAQHVKHVSPRTTSEDRSRRRMAITVMVAGTVLVVGWVAAVAAIAGGGGGAENATGDGPDQQQAASADTPADAAPETTGDEGSEGHGQQNTPPESAEEDGEGSGETTDTGQVFDPLEEDQSQPTPDAGSDSGSPSQPTGETESEPEVVSPEPASSTGDGQPQGSTESQPSQPTGGSSETEAVRAAIERYISAAYGYTGQSKEEYLAAIDEAASEEIYDSPGGSMLEGYSQAAPECGMKSTAVLGQFKVLGRSPEGLDVTVTFSVEDADGQVHTFSQDQRLVASDEGYEVSGVSAEELISDTTPKESCPGAHAAEEESADNSQSNPETPDGPENKAKTGTLTETDQAKARAVVERFVTAAYGYTGDSGEEYADGVSRSVEESFLDSPGGERVRGYALSAEKNGIESAAILDDFELTRVGPDEVEGTAYFRVAKEHDRYARLKGEATSFEQKLTLSETDSSYLVSAAGVEKEVSDQGHDQGHERGQEGGGD